MIRNIYINDIWSKGASGIGLFGATEGATISNLSITGDINCYNNNESSRRSRAGGIVGSANRGKNIIVNCNNYCNISSYGPTGGIVGCRDNGSVKIIQCGNFGKIKTLSRRRKLCINRRNLWRVRR